MITNTFDSATTVKVRRVLDFALSYVGLGDGCLGQRRGFDVDAWAKELGAAKRSSWDAIIVAKARREGGLWIPRYDVGALDEWFYEARALGLATEVPQPGAVVLYGSSSNDVTLLHGGWGSPRVVAHMGLVVCTSPKVMSVERDGPGCRQCGRRQRSLSVREVDLSRVLCFIDPE